MPRHTHKYVQHRDEDSQNNTQHTLRVCSVPTSTCVLVVLVITDLQTLGLVHRQAEVGAQVEHLKVEVGSLVEQLNEARAAAHTAGARAEAAFNELNTLSSELIMTKEHLAESDNDLSEAQGALERMSEDVDTHKDQAASSIARASALDDQMRNAAAQLQAMTHKATQAEHEVEATRKTIFDCEATTSAMAQSMAQARQDLEQAAQANQEAAARHAAEMEAANSRAAQHASELKAANRRAVEAQNVGDSANRRAAATYSNVTSTMAQLETKIFEYKDSLNAKNKEIGRLQAMVHQQCEERMQLLSRLADSAETAPRDTTATDPLLQHTTTRHSFPLIKTPTANGSLNASTSVDSMPQKHESPIDGCGESQPRSSLLRSSSYAGRGGGRRSNRDRERHQRVSKMRTKMPT